jgi:hypothetical protein
LVHGLLFIQRELPQGEVLGYPPPADVSGGHSSLRTGVCYLKIIFNFTCSEKLKLIRKLFEFG